VTRSDGMWAARKASVKLLRGEPRQFIGDRASTMFERCSCALNSSGGDIENSSDHRGFKSP
jgi:hypothetical protein